MKQQFSNRPRNENLPVEQAQLLQEGLLPAGQRAFVNTLFVRPEKGVPVHAAEYREVDA